MPPSSSSCRMFEHEIIVRPTDVDSARHLNHVAMIAFFEFGRMRAHRDIRERCTDLPDMNTVVRALSVGYLAQASMFETLRIRSWVLRDGATSRTWAQELVRPDGVIVATAQVTSVLVDSSFRPARLPGIYRDAFAEWREDG